MTTKPFKPGTMLNAHLVWMSIMDATAMTGRNARDIEREDGLTFWIRTCAVCIIFTAALTSALMGLLFGLIGGR